MGEVLRDLGYCFSGVSANNERSDVDCCDKWSRNEGAPCLHQRLLVKQRAIIICIFSCIDYHNEWFALDCNVLI